MSRFLTPRPVRTRSKSRRPLRPRLRIESLEDRTVPSLTLSLADPAIVEGSKTAATLTRTGDLSQPLTVTLDSSRPAEVSIPGAVTIAAGKSSITFGVFGVDDTAADGVQSVNILAWVNGGGDSTSATIKVYDNDSPPTVNPDSYSLTEDIPLTVYGFGVLANDFSGNGDMTASLVSGPSHGTVALGPGGGFTYTPAQDYNGPDSFTYRATDPAGFSGVATVSLTIGAMNDPTQLTVPGPQTTPEDTPITFSAANGNAFRITDVEDPRVLVALVASPGILTLRSTDGLEFPDPGPTNNNNWITFIADNPAEANAALEGMIYTPQANYNGSTSISILVRDLTSGTPYTDVNGWIPITVTPVNDPPVAVNDTYEGQEDIPVNTYGLGVLGNDQDVEWDPLHAILVSGPSHGTVTLNPNGTFSYTPDPNYYGTDSFTYRAADPTSQSANVATVTLIIHPVDDPIQVTNPVTLTTAEDTPLTFSAVTGSAITVVDPESPPVMVSLVAGDGILTLPSTAGLEFPDPNSLNNSKSITFYADDPAEANAALEGLRFTPNANFNGSSWITIQVRDRSFVTAPVDAWGKVSLTVSPVNDAPVAVNDGPYTIEAGETLVTTSGGGGGGLGVLLNDTDVDGNVLSAVLVSGPSHGTLTLSSDGGFAYTADSAYSGVDTFTYQASDGQLQSNVATVTITVTPRNQAPVTAADAYSVNEDGGLVVAAPGVLGNDADPEGQPITAQLATGPSHGTLALNADGGFKYAPDPNYSGSDGFWYRATDGVRTSAPTFVTLTVNPVNDAPVAAADSYTLDEDMPLTVAAPGLLANDTDVDGDTLSAAVVTGPAHGTVVVNADGSFVYTPAANYNGADSFAYKASDPSGASSTATVSLTVRAVNDAPVAVNDSYSGTEDTAISAVVPGTTSITMTSDPGDYIGQGQTYSLSAANGSISISRNYDNGVSVRWTNISGSQWWSFDFAAPDNGLLMPGMYSNAMRFPFQTAGRPGMDVSGMGRGSNTLTGWFRIDEIAYAPNGDVLVFNATFEQHSEGATPALRGTVRYNAGGTAPGGVVLNDSDAEGSPLTASLVQGPAHGQLVFNPNGTFMYVPQANFYGTDSFQYRVSDGSAYSNVATVTLNVAGVNDAPVNAVPATQTLVEDTTLTFSTANGNAIRLTDVDAGSSVVELRLSVNGFLTFPTTAGLTFVSGSNGGNLMTVRGTLADLNAALDGLVFRPGANFNGTYSLQVITNDLGNTGSGGAKSDLDYVDLNITRVNDPPQNVVPLVTPVTPEDTPLTFSPAIWVADADASTESNGAPIRVTLEFAAGGGTLSVTPGGGVTITGNGTGQVVLAGPLTYVNNVLRTLVFTPLANANNLTAPVQIRMTTDDQANGGPGALTDVDVFAVSVTPVNDAPTTSGLGPVSVNEDAAPTSVSLTGGFGDVEDGSAGLTYSVTGNSNPGLFSAVTVVNGVLTLNYAPNANGSATLTVRGTDSGGLWAETPLTVTVSAVNDTPTSAGLPPVSVAEDSGPTTVTLTDYFGDVEDGASGLTYSVVGNTNPGLFSSVSVSGGVLTLSYAANANGSATVTVRATDAGGLWVEAPLSVTVAPVNDAPTSTGLSPVTVAEDAAPTAVTLTSSFGDVEDGAAGLTYSVVGNSNPGLFGSLSVANGVLTLDYAPNASGSATLTVRATDSGGLWVEAPLAVIVTAVNDAPTTTGLAPVSVSEDTAPTSITLTGSFADIEDGASGLTYSVTGNTNAALFSSVSVSGGVLTLNYASNASGTATLTVRATDSGGLWVEAPLAVTAAPVNDAPTTSGLPAVSVNEDAAPTAVTLTNSFGDIEDGASGLTYAVVGNTNPGLFSSVTVSGGVLTLNYAANASGSATLTVRATDSGGLWVEAPLAVTATAVNDAPTSSGLPPVTVAEDAAPTAVTLTNYFGDVEDGAASLAYTVTGNTNPGLFSSVSLSNGVLTLAYAPNANGSATLTIRATDSGGLFMEAPLAVTVTPVNDAPTTTGLSPVSVLENAAPTSITLTGSFADVEDGSSGLTYTVTGNTNPGLFSAVSVSGGVLTLNYAANAYGTANLTVRATDSGGLWVESPLAVTVNSVNDAPTTSGLPAVSVAEDAPATGVTLTNYFGDIEDGAGGLTYSVVGNTNPGLFGSVSVSGGVLTLNYGANLSGSATITVRATDSGGLFVETPLAVTVRPVNDAPTFTAGPNVTVASDAGPQTFAGWATAIGAGPANEAGQTLTFDVSTDSPLLFAIQPSIDPATGTLRFTPVVGASGTATVTVILRDNGGTADGGIDSSTPVTFTITLNPPAGTPGVQVVGTTLIVTGGTGADSVTISVANGGNGSAGLKVTGTVNGQAVNKTFKQTFTGIRVSTDGGNDTVSIADGVGLPTTVDGGAGDDSLKGGGGNDLIFGGTGNDTINGAAGDDDIDAGAGNDSVAGGQGRDLVFGQAGADTLQGGDGNDFLIGGLGADQVFGQNGDDILVAGSVTVRNPSSDSLRQVLTDWGPTVPGIYATLRSRLAVTDDPASADRLQGDAQTDWFWSSDPTDTLDLGTGEQRN